MWSGWREAISVFAYPAHLKKTIGIGLGVGTVLFCVISARRRDSW